LITIDPLVSSIDAEMLRRMSFLGYRCFGLTFDKLSDNIQSNAMKLGMRVIYWQQKKDVKDIEGILMRAQVVNTRFTLLKIPLNFRFQETKEYIRKNQRTLSNGSNSSFFIDRVLKTCSCSHTFTFLHYRLFLKRVLQRVPPILADSLP